MKIFESKYWMRKSCPGLATGLKALSLLMMAFVAMTFSSAVLAQDHGSGVLKSCTVPVRDCVDDTSCPAGDDLCMPAVCDTTAGRMSSCVITYLQLDTFNDNRLVLEAFDTVATANGPRRVPAVSGNLPITSVTGGAASPVNPCTVGGSLPCNAGPGQIIKFTSNYALQANDVGGPGGFIVLNDQATVKDKDGCDVGGAGGGCSNADNTLQTTGATPVVDGCGFGNRLTCDPDDDACTQDFDCDASTGLCPAPGSRTVCDPDNDACTQDFECDATTGLCPDPGPRTVCDPDDDACTEDFACDPATGLCPDPGPRTVCDPDDDACTQDFACDPATGLCPAPGPRTVCDPDDDACTQDFACDPATGLCPDPGPRTVCDPDDDACTEDFACDPATGLCPDPGPRTVCDPDDDACTEDFACDPATGLCPDPGPRTVCDPDDDACTEDFACDPATGLCPDPGPRTVCDPDDDECTEDFACDPATGLCPAPGPRTVCDPDDDECTQDFECDATTGLCPAPIPIDPLPISCSAVEICRTPGFWATHGGDDKNGSTDITQAVINYAGGIDVCGEVITTTDPNTIWSSSNAMCTAVKGVKERQLVRQLTAMALNCVMSGGGGDCSGTSIQGLAQECNALCGGAGEDTRSINDCISEIDCFNNGGAWDGNQCIAWIGSCSESGNSCDSGDDSNCEGFGDVCEKEPSCHDRELCQESGDLCFNPPGPAGGVDNCKEAKKNGNYLPY